MLILSSLSPCKGEDPLPAGLNEVIRIHSIPAMKVCPVTGSKDFEAIPRIAID